MTTDTYVASSDSNNLTGTSTRARGPQSKQKRRPESRPLASHNRPPHRPGRRSRAWRGLSQRTRVEGTLAPGL